MKLGDRTRRSSLVLTVFVVILMLIFAGPSSAVMVKLDMDGMKNKQVGQTGFFFFNVTIGGNERIPIADFTIDGLPHINGSDGSPSGTLLFNVNDGTLNKVNGYFKKGNYNITLVERHGWTGGTTNVTGNASNYGYSYPQPYLGYGYGYTFSGYGYGYGLSSSSLSPNQYTKLSYRITVDTTGATAGTYSSVTGNVNTGPMTKCFQSSTTSFTLDAPTPTPTRRRSSGGGGGGTYPPETTPTPTVTATETPTTAATAAPPGEQVTPRPTITRPTATATETAAERATAKTPKTGLPGFTAVFAIAGLLAIAYVMMRQKR